MHKVILVRPGCTEFDEQQRIQGSLDLPLSDRGTQQVDQLLADLAETEIDIVYASPTEPALSTAERLAESRGIPCKSVDALANVNQGLWQGLQIEELKRKIPKVFKQWQESPTCVCPPDGESLADALERVKLALEKPLRKKGRIAIVAADPIACLIAAVVNGTSLVGVSPICTGGCGTWVVLSDHADGQNTAQNSHSDLSQSSAEFPAVTSAVLRPT